MQESGLFEVFKPMSQEDFQARFSNPKELGEGSYGCVKSYYDLHHSRHVAIKQIKFRTIKYQTKTVIREALAHKFEHYNLMKILQYFSIDNCICFVLQCCERGALDQSIEKISSRDRLQLLEFFIGIARGVKAFHDHEYMHRDLKPANILITMNQLGKIIPKIGDYGCLKKINAENTQLIGTPVYSDPLTKETGTYGKECDIFSLGVILLQLLTGVHPFRKWSHLNIVTFVQNQLQYQKNLVHELNKLQLNNELKLIIRKCLTADKDRYTIDQLILVLEQHLKEQENTKHDILSKTSIETSPKEQIISQERIRTELSKTYDSNSQEKIPTQSKYYTENLSLEHHPQINQVKIIYKERIAKLIAKDTIYEVKEFCVFMKQHLSLVKKFDLPSKHINTLNMLLMIMCYHHVHALAPSQYLKGLVPWFHLHIRKLVDNVIFNINDQSPTIYPGLENALLHYEHQKGTQIFRNYLLRKCKELRLTYKEQKVIDALLTEIQ